MQCSKCSRHRFTMVEETDKKTKKRWLIRRCIVCNHPNDILPYEFGMISRIDDIKDYWNELDHGNNPDQML